MMYTATPLLLAGLGVPFVRGQGFSSECKDLYFKQNWVVGTCSTNDGTGEITSSVFLPNKIGNSEATLKEFDAIQWQTDGHFSQSCNSCTLIDNGSTLQCYCKATSNQGSKTTTLNLEEHIANYDGHLLSNLTRPMTTIPENSEHAVPSDFGVEVQTSSLKNNCTSIGAYIGLNYPQDCYYLNLGVGYSWACGTSVNNHGWKVVGYSDKACKSEPVVTFTPENVDTCVDFESGVVGFGVIPLWNAD